MQVALAHNSTNAVPLHAICYARELDRALKPNDAFSYCEIGSVDMFGVGEPFWLDEDEIEPGSEEERVLKKIEKGDIGVGKPGTILVPKVRPYLGKFVLVTGSETYYTRAFLELHPKGIKPETLYACLKHPLVLEQIYRVCTIGKGYPTITPFDLTRAVYVPAVLLTSNPEQLHVVNDKVGQIFNHLSEMVPERSLIDQIINKALDPNGERFCTTPIKKYSWKHSQIVLSHDIRFSPHFVNPASRKLLARIRRLKHVPLSKLCSAPIILGISPDTFVPTSDFYYLGSRAMSTEAFR